MFQPLAELEARYEALEEQLASPGVASNPARLRELSVELAELRERVLAYRRWRKLGTELAATEALRGDGAAEIRELAEADRKLQRAALEVCEAEMRALLAPRDPRDGRNVVLEIRAGAGGDEAALFAADLFRMYTRYAERHAWRVELISA